MKRFVSALLLLAASCGGQVLAPRVGIAADRGGGVRPVVGIAGNLLEGEPLAVGAISAAASGSAVAIKTKSEVRVTDIAGRELARAQAGGGPALFAFAADGSVEFVWLSETQMLMRRCATGFCDCRMRLRAIQGTVVAIGTADRNHVDMAVSQDRSIEILRVRLGDGAIADRRPLPDAASAPLLMGDGSMVYAAAGELVSLDARGRERRTPFAHTASSIVPMSAEWALIDAKAEGRRFAVRLADGAAFQIPEVR